MSKANRAFVRNEEAVSPVIGVILMVAITVVLAAVVFVLVSNLGEGSEAAPSISFNKNSAERTLTVVSADPADWDDFAVSVSGTGCTAELTTATSSGVTTLPAESVDAGDSFFLDEAMAGNCSGVTFRLTHTATNTLVYSTTF